ncbi:MAG: hypothetical protein ACJAXR_002395 [Halopseudomonas sp.]
MFDVVVKAFGVHPNMVGQDMDDNHQESFPGDAALKACYTAATLIQWPTCFPHNPVRHDP